MIVYSTKQKKENKKKYFFGKDAISSSYFKIADKINSCLIVNKQTNIFVNNGNKIVNFLLLI